MLRMPTQLHESIASAAAKNSQSINAEIVSRLEVSLLTGVVGRLKSLLEQLQEVLGSDQISVSILAEGVGEDTPSRLEQVFAGREEASFELLDKIAEYMKVNAKWLKHGVGQPFEVSLVNDNGIDLVFQLMGEMAETTFLIRSDSQYGEVCIVQKFTNRNWKLLNPNMNLSLNLQVGGLYALGSFANACRLLYAANLTKTHSYMMESSLFNEVVRGDAHPLAALKKSRRSYWFDDWWDFELISSEKRRPDCWEGYAELCKSVHRYIMDDDKLRNELEDIRSGKLTKMIEAEQWRIASET
ncbi:hypothetical protein PsWM33_02370 [Pseudovibrio sp. WM33]|nr:hypothetical protein PsWM33_02370 [Pseudovibrio sp. WM33]